MGLGRGVYSIDNFWKGLWLPNTTLQSSFQFHVQSSSLQWLSVRAQSWFSVEVCKTRRWQFTIHGSLGNRNPPSFLSPIKSLNATCLPWQIFQVQGPVLDIRAEEEKKKKKTSGKANLLRSTFCISGYRFSSQRAFFIIFAFFQKAPCSPHPHPWARTWHDIYHLHAQTFRILHTPYMDSIREIETEQEDVYFQAVSQSVTIRSGQGGLGSSSSPPSNYIEGSFETLFSRSDLEHSSFGSSFF